MTVHGRIAALTRFRDPWETDRNMPGILPILSNLDDFAESMANPSPDRPLQEGIAAAGRKVCDAISNAPAWYRNSNPAGSLMGLVCRPYWDSEGISPPVAVPPFNGGQCQNIQYSVNVFRNTSGGQVFVAQLYARGPITELSVTFLGNFQYRMRIVGSTGFDQRDIGVLAGEAAPSFGPLTRQDGQPDNCGNPPTVVGPGPSPSPRNPVIPPGERPFFDDDGDEVLPIPDIPGTPVSPPVEIPDFPFSPPQPPVPPSGVTVGPGQGGTPVATGLGEEAAGEADEGEVLTGLRLELIEAPARANQFEPGVYRGAAYVRMGTSSGLDLDPAGASISDGQFVFAEKDYLTHWSVTATTGYNWRVIPFYEQKPS